MLYLTLLVALPNESRQPADGIEVEAVKHMLDVLFFFARSPDPTSDAPEAEEKFQQAIRFHICQLVAVLIRRATYADHLFLADHLLHCPGIADWAANFLQFPILLEAWYLLLVSLLASIPLTVIVGLVMINLIF